MKFKVTMKDPDTLHDTIEDEVKADIASLGLSGDEADAIKDVRVEKVSSLCSTWFRYGELLTVEIDTDAKTCTVVPAS